MEKTMSDTKIYLDLSDDIQQLFYDNKISINDVMRQENIDSTISYGIIPGQEREGERSKDLTTIILASSAAVIAIGTAISQIIRTLQRKPHLVKYIELIELRDAEGNIILDLAGKPQFKQITKYELLEPRKEDTSKNFEVNWTTESGIVMKFSSAEKQLDTLPSK
jgi:hypothetical protein